MVSLYSHYTLREQGEGIWVDADLQPVDGRRAGGHDPHEIVQGGYVAVERLQPIRSGKRLIGSVVVGVSVKEEYLHVNDKIRDSIKFYACA